MSKKLSGSEFKKKAQEREKERKKSSLMFATWLKGKENETESEGKCKKHYIVLLYSDVTEYNNIIA